MIKDLETSISDKNYHDFVSKLVVVETQIVSEKYPINETDSPQKSHSKMRQRCAQYMRNTSLAKNAMLHECTKYGLGHNVYQAIKDGNADLAKTRLQNLEIPDYLQDHYSTIRKFYKKNNNELGATTNFTFHALNTSITGYAKIELSQDDSRKVMLDANKISKSVYSTNIEGSREKLLDQIPNSPEEVSVDFSNKTKPTLLPNKEVQKLNFAQRFINAIKEFGQKISKLFQKETVKASTAQSRSSTPNIKQDRETQVKINPKARVHAIKLGQSLSNGSSASNSERTTTAATNRPTTKKSGMIRH